MPTISKNYVKKEILQAKAPASLHVCHGDNLQILQALPDESVELVYIDPPFNTGKKQKHTKIKTTQDESGTRKGFGGHSYKELKLGSKAYGDVFDDYWKWLGERLVEIHRVLTPNGSLYLHLDWRETHYARFFLDSLFGKESFLNEIIWSYDFGGRSKKLWPRKHDNILFYVKDPENYVWNYNAVNRIPYMSPGLVGKEKEKRGKFPTDVWWHTIVPTNSAERTGYPTQKPKGILERIVAASSSPGSVVMDAFGGSGTTGEVALELERRAILVDENNEAIDTMEERFKPFGEKVRFHNFVEKK